MFQIIFTSDYEIHANGDGDPYKLMVETTERQMDFLAEYGGKLTILADVPEIMKYEEYKLKYGEDKYHYDAIINQLRKAVATGHDVQLHIHSSYMKAEYEEGNWQQNWDEFNLAALSYERINEIVAECKGKLEEEIRKEVPGYNCHAFRAAGWSMSPTKNIYRALVNNGINIDTSVWKNGKYRGNIDFDYSNAHDALIPWFASEDDIATLDPDGKMLEIPIYCEDKSLYSFITPIRIFRTIRSRFHKHTVSEKNKKDVYKADTGKETSSGGGGKLGKLFRKYPFKLDLNYPTGRQLIGMMKNIEKNYGGIEGKIPVVVSSHSKSFVRGNESAVKSFMKYLHSNPDKYEFAIFGDVDREYFRNFDYKRI